MEIRGENTFYQASTGVLFNANHVVQLRGRTNSLFCCPRNDIIAGLFLFFTLIRKSTTRVAYIRVSIRVYVVRWSKDELYRFSDCFGRYGVLGRCVVYLHTVRPIPSFCRSTWKRKPSSSFCVVFGCCC